MNIYFFDKKYFYYSISYFFSLSFQTISRQIIFVNKIKKKEDQLQVFEIKKREIKREIKKQAFIFAFDKFTFNINFFPFR